MCFLHGALPGSRHFFPIKFNGQSADIIKVDCRFLLYLTATAKSVNSPGRKSLLPLHSAQSI